MRNVFFPEEEVTKNDLYFVCSMIERIARKLKQRNKYVVNGIGKAELEKKLSVANVQHSENPDAVVHQWIEDFDLKEGDFDITNVNPDLATIIPTPLQMGKVYTRLILATILHSENYADGILRVYNNPICEIIDNYNSSAFYEPSYFITRAYYQGSFN